MRIPAITRLIPGLLAGLLCSQVAEASCDAPYTVDALLGDLIEVESALREGDDELAGGQARRLEQGLGCLNEVLPMQIAGRAYRAVGAGLVVAGDRDRGAGWLRTAAEIEQSFEYGLEDLSADHPVREVYAEARMAFAEPQRAAGMALAAEGTHYLDGRKIEQPQARLERSHVYQLDQGGVKTWTIDGNAFPASVLVPAAVVADAGEDDGDKKGKKGKKEKEPKVAKVKDPKPDKVAKVKEPKPNKVAAKQGATSGSSSGPTIVGRQRPPEKTPLMIGGGVIMLGAGGVYALAMQRKAAFQGAEVEADVLTFARQANQLALASAAILAVGTGTMTWGIILDGGGSPLPSLNVRF